MSGASTKVVNIAGSGRSGSTILGNTLGQLDGLLHVGELCYIWNRGFLRNALCGCGQPFRECSLWREVLKHPAIASLDVPFEVLARIPRTFNRRLPWAMLRGGSIERRDNYVQLYLSCLQKLYYAIMDVSRCNVIVDSSKVPAHSYFLMNLPDADVYYLHLVRDPRAVVYSWQRKIVRLDANREGTNMMDRVPVQKSAVKWILANLTLEILRWKRHNRVLTLRYEQFIDQPHNTIQTIANFIKHDKQDLDFIGDNSVNVRSSHTVWGNYNRLQTGSIRLRVDEQWRSEMKKADRLLVTAMTWPMLLRYYNRATRIP